MKRLGLKAVMMPSYVKRPIPRQRATSAEAGALRRSGSTPSASTASTITTRCGPNARSSRWCPRFHSHGEGWGSRTSISNYVYNHIGHFAAAGEAMCKSLFLGGVTRRFPDLKFLFLEGGVGWARSAVRRPDGALGKAQPQGAGQLRSAQRRSRAVLPTCYHRYGGKLLRDAARRAAKSMQFGIAPKDPATIDDFVRCGIEQQGGHPRPVRAALSTSAARPTTRLPLPPSTPSAIPFRRAAQRDVRLRYRPFRRPRHDRGHRRGLRDGRGGMITEDGFPRLRLRQSGQAMDRGQSRLLQGHGGRKRGLALPVGGLRYAALITSQVLFGIRAASVSERSIHAR